MSKPKISVLLCTARPDYPYTEHPELHVLDKVIADLSVQTFQDFELIIVDGCRRVRKWTPTDAGFPVTWIAPFDNFWTRNKKVAICTYRNTGIVHARGELVVNLDDCCTLPENYLEYAWSFWDMFEACMVAQAPNDPRPSGFVKDNAGMPYPMVYGFNSYPLDVVLRLGGYDLLFDGGQGLEDGDFGARLHHAGVKHVLHKVPDFDILAQSGFSEHAIDLKKPIAKCCNRVWTLRRQIKPNWTCSSYDGVTQRDLHYLVSPTCPMLADKCAYHNHVHACAFPEIAEKGDKVANELLGDAGKELLAFNLRREWVKRQGHSR